MSISLNIDSLWIRKIKNGQQPSSIELKEHLFAVHKSNPGFTEELAWSCRNIDGKNSYDLLADIIEPNKHNKILDLACGSGILLDLCFKRYGKSINLFGIDMSEDELKLAREKLTYTNIKLYKCMAQELNFISKKSIDVIFCHWALTLMDPVIPVLRNVNRMLGKKGIFAAIIDGDSKKSRVYHEVYKIIYEYVQLEYPKYGKIEIGDSRIRKMNSLYTLSKEIFVGSTIKIIPHILNLNASSKELAREVSGFFYASYVLSSKSHKKMLLELEDYFISKFKTGCSVYSMPINLLIIKKNN